ncbi:LIC_13387 family protein [Leptospira terpstrae]|uniref:Uncharacterized protein n=1 Tax=Leptospira terpstrae serovar Hualin str. LT 11-33 = ATCC 700639 TaxID=1257025 RepID=N1VNA7_9LEPT|nr:hypothetical protein [Leptospira terpstrae]EMY59923.1 hypothetical protein LEP1GSC203_0078 [Leptospira terpstrae serovar Hualin str. LT 11-33 = ATCC 700639]
MNAKLFLRISAGLLIFHLIGHSFGNATWDQTEDPIKQNVIHQMIEHKFPFMGTNRSMGEYFYGYGLITSIALSILAIYFLILSASLSENQKLARKLIWATTIALLVTSTIEFLYFFPFAAGTTLLASVFAGLAAVNLPKESK